MNAHAEPARYQLAQDPGAWQAADGNWYPAELHPDESHRAAHAAGVQDCGSVGRPGMAQWAMKVGEVIRRLTKAQLVVMTAAFVALGLVVHMTAAAAFPTGNGLCSVLAEGEVRDRAGLVVDDATSNDGRGYTRCVYSGTIEVGPGDAAGRRGTVVVTLHEQVSDRRQDQLDDDRRITGLGDEAWKASDSIWVRSGDRYLAIDVDTYAHRSNNDAARQLAELALNRM